MEFTGTITGVVTDWSNKQSNLSVLADRDITRQIQKLSECDKVSITITKWHPKRSKRMNNYYWSLCEELALVLGTSKFEVHNTMLARYGRIKRDEQGNPIPALRLDSINYLKEEHEHLLPTQKTMMVGDRLFRWFYELKGSSEFDSREMTALINGIISECEELEIDTKPRSEIDKMLEEWGMEYAKQKNQSPAVRQ